MVDQVGREVFDLLLGELDFLEPGDDLVVGEEALLLPCLDELVELFDVGKGDVDSEHPRDLRLLGWLDGTYKTLLTSRRLPSARPQFRGRTIHTRVHRTRTFWTSSGGRSDAVPDAVGRAPADSGARDFRRPGRSSEAGLYTARSQREHFQDARNQARAIEKRAAAAAESTARENGRRPLRGRRRTPPQERLPSVPAGNRIELPRTLPAGPPQASASSYRGRPRRIGPSSGTMAIIAPAAALVHLSPFRG